jgi:hypothetical protein
MMFRKSLAVAVLASIQVTALKHYQMMQSHNEQPVVELQSYVTDEHEVTKVQDYLLDEGYWFEMCMNIHEAFSYCKQGQKPDASAVPSYYPTYTACTVEE